MLTGTERLHQQWEFSGNTALDSKPQCLPVQCLKQYLVNSRCLWRLILCVNVTEPQGVQMFCWTRCLWECFWVKCSMRLTFENVYWVKADCSHWCGCGVSDLLKARIEQKGWVRENSLSDCCWVGMSVFSCPWTWASIKTYTISSPGSQTFGLRLEPNFWLSWISSLPNDIF